MQTEVVYVVGDKYEEFARNNHVLTISNAKASSNVFQARQQLKKIYRVCQGVTRQEIEDLNAIIENNHLEKYFQVEKSIFNHQKETKQIVHKRKEENVMITIPEQIGKNNYKSLLLLDENCAENSDHITGQHIQGMVLIEAARQMMLSVAERYILLPHQKQKSYFVLNKMSTNFLCFTFPIEVSINCCITNLDKKANGSLKSSFLVVFEQLNKVVTEIEIEFSVYSQEFIKQIEETMAARVIESALDSMGAPQKKIVGLN